MNDDCFFISSDASSWPIAEFFLVHKQSGFLLTPNYFLSPQEVRRKHWGPSEIHSSLFLAVDTFRFAHCHFFCLSASLLSLHLSPTLSPLLLRVAQHSKEINFSVTV